MIEDGGEAGQPVPATPASAIAHVDISTRPTMVRGFKPIDWQDFRQMAGNDPSARSRFEALVASLVAINNPGAHQLRGDGGDWGLDVVVGEIIPGEEVAVWQAKWFPDHIGGPERTQITKSFDTVMEKATQIGYRISVWTLVVPYLLTPAERNWWGKFKREREKTHHVQMALWEATELERRLNVREAIRLRQIYFGSPETPEPLAIQPLPDAERYDTALFVRQLEAAGVRESQAARQQFFNAEVLRREVRNKALDEEVDELEQRSSEVLSIWEARFAGAGPTGAEARRLYADVCEALENHHRGSSLRSLRASLNHTLGLMHFHVDESRAGWVKAWRGVADAHSS